MSSIIVAGDTSGSVTLQAPNIAGSQVVTLPYGSATTTSSAVDITLTNTSNRVQDVTMTAADKSVILPDATTMAIGANVFTVNNRGGRAFYIKNNGGVIIAVVKPFASVQLNLNANATANGTWSKQEGDIFFGQYIPSTVSTSKSYINNTNLITNVGNAGTFSNNNAGVVSVKKISSTTALILWSSPLDQTNSSLQNLQAVVATVSAGSITYGTSVTVYTGTTTGLVNFGAVVLSSTAAFVIVDKNNATASAVYPLVLSGSTITVGTAATFGPTTGNGHTGTDICYLSATTAMLSYIGSVATTNGLRASTLTHNGSSAPTISTALTINANGSQYCPNRLIPLTSTTCQLIYQTASAGTLSTAILTSTGASTAPTLGTAIVTSYLPFSTGSDYCYEIIAYPYSSTETAAIVGNNTQISFTISGTTITEQSYTCLYSSTNSFTANAQPIGSIAWFNSTQGVYLRTTTVAYSGIACNLVPVAYTVGTGISVGDTNITTTTINGYGAGAIDQLDSTTAIAAIPSASGLQAEVVTLL